ncbi:MAG: RagB/SusD family nutrient uptake outer membrane protein [Chitinophagaceae bacterium]|nr:MAG: RagB/SusD family nutrient uptake outer membrane protein [Chitinophagaceae bacterium]
MKLKLYYIAISLFGLALTACKKDNLDKFPTSNIPLDQSFRSVRDAKTWNTGLYGLLRGAFYGIYQYNQDIQGNQLNATIDFGNRNGFPHRWEGFEATETNINAAWSGYYRGIANANIMLDGFENIVPANATETSELDRYKGDAHAIRAYYYHELVTRYAKPYSPVTAANEPGVPLILNYDVYEMPPRSTVKAVYDQIIADLAQAKAKLGAVTGAQGSTRFTIDAVNALEARVRLHMQDWAGAKAAADAVIAANKYPLYNTAAGIQSYWHSDAKQEDIMQLYVANTTEQANTNGAIYLGFRTNDNLFRPDFVPSLWVMDKYPATDLRKPVFFATKPVTFTSGTGNLILINKFPGNPTLFTATTTNYQHAPKFLRIAEMYLVSAEAGARGSADADGLSKLNSLRLARGLSALAGLADDALFAEVKDERFRELAFEGFRLWDLKRWSEGFTRSAPQNVNLLTVGTGYTSLSVASDNPKFVWGIPSNDITVNPNIQQNPGW